MLHLISRLCLASVFLFSAINGVNGDFKNSVNYVKSKNLPFPFLLALGGLIVKIFGSYSLITNKYLKYSIPLLILFLIMIIIFFKSPWKGKKNLYSSCLVLGVIGGLLLLNQNSISNN